MRKSLLACLMIATTSAAFAVAPAGDSRQEPRPSLEELTATLLGESGAGGAELLTVAAERRERLARLIEAHPAEVFRLAVPPGFRETLPSPTRDHVEERIELEGTLQVLYEDGYETSRLLHFLDTDSGDRYSLHFASRPPDLLSDTRVKLRGLRVGEAVAIESGAKDIQRASDRQAMMSVSTNPFGAQRTAVLLVTFASNPVQPYTLAAARNVVFTTTSNWDLENSYQQTWLTGDVFGWYTISASPTTCDYSTIASQARTAATAAGVNLSNYSHYVFAFPDMACSWWGLGSVGGNPSYAWINGSLALTVVAHEMGHNFGLYHSHSLDCGSVVLGPTCTMTEYGDVLDTMGGGNGYEINAFQKERLGWLNYGSSPPIKTVTSSGTYTIDPYESLGTAPKALKIPRGTTGYYFYVEVRRGLGFDAGFANSANVSNGVVIHWASPSYPDSSDLLDMTPTTSTWGDPALTTGQTYTDPNSGVSITVNSVSGTGASVTVALNGTPPPTCTHVGPAVSVTSSTTGGVSAGTKVTYTVSVTNKDVSPCTVSSFNLGASAPSGWTVALGASSLSIAPGASASTTLQVTSPTSAASGTYPINGTATNGGATSATTPFSATYTVSSSGGGSGGAGTFSDNFNNRSSLGSAWSVVSGNLVLSSNMLKNAPQVGTHMAVVSAVSGAFQIVDADFTSTDNNLGPRFGLVLRYQDPKNYYLIYRQVGGSSRLLISRIVNGVEKILASASIANPARNVSFHLTGRVSGKTLSLDFNGANKLNVTEPTSTFSTGKVGILIGSSARTTQYQADNFSASAH